jgi:hypothetical protein
MECIPTAREAIEIDAAPPTTGAEPSEAIVVVSINVTVPVKVPEAAEVTSAVSITD